ncbi:phage terminase large subunit family protein [Shinella sp.]|uniref:phage terminase large subunit family protein n=1 Tax=Shinella sp. TaxID=1870904 RepID=UPI00258D66DE|nr:phage terminase large subunit family protein [Shinella sp.]MCW5706111.1 phage terminase large subunit family protein [Shinella sp.]
MKLLHATRRKAMAAWRPPPKTTLSTWAETNIRLPSSVSALPGRISLYPYQRDIADAISDPLVERVTLVKSVRLGFSTLLTAGIFSFVANDPSPILVVQPTEDDCRDYLVSDIEPIAAASPSVSKLLTGDTKEGKRDNMLARRFPGGSLKIVAAKSPRNLRRHNVRVLFIDEADAMHPGAEGNPIKLAEKRTLQFGNRKIVMGSTPVNLATSNVLSEYAKSDKRIYQVRCHECKAFEEIHWKDIRWDKDEDGKDLPATASWCCPSCGVFVDHKHKASMVANGRWLATAPEVKGHAGFRCNALISNLPNTTWSQLVEDFLHAKKDPEDLRVFINTLLAEGTGDGADELDEQTLYNRREQFGLDSLPEDVLTISVGVDVQHTWLEVVTIGWSRHGVAYVLDHRRIEGRWDDNVTWLELDEHLKSRWRHPLGGMLGVETAAIDSSDGVTMEAVYSFCFPRARRKVLAIKGMSGSRQWITPSHQKKRGGVLWQVGVDSVKTALFDRLKTRDFFRFSMNLELVFFEQLTGEKLYTHYKRGARISEFVPVKGRRHECLDAVAYAMAAHRGLNINLDRRESELKQEPQAAPRPRVIESDWIKGLNG